jgi:hypothetical protein
VAIPLTSSATRISFFITSSSRDFPVFRLTPLASRIVLRPQKYRTRYAPTAFDENQAPRLFIADHMSWRRLGRALSVSSNLSY